MLCRHFRHQVLSGVTLLQASTASFSTAVYKCMSDIMINLGTVSDIKVSQNGQMLVSAVTLSYGVTTEGWAKSFLAIIILRNFVENGSLQSTLSTLSGVSITGVSGYTIRNIATLSPTSMPTKLPTSKSNVKSESNLGLGLGSEGSGNGTEVFDRER